MTGKRAAREKGGDSSVQGLEPAQVRSLAVTPFGKYRFAGKLGHGGMAEVFLAYVAGPADFRKLCVIKRLHAHLVGEPGFVEMFLDEARLAARLNHPNVVQTFEVGECEGAYFIAMEYLQGQSLDRVRRQCGLTSARIPVEVAAQVLMAALDGLQYAHELKDFDGTPLGIIHRDVSPQNIFVTYDGVVKLLDFGIAKAATHVVETRTGVVKGKYAYLSPEQARALPIDHRSDLWSAGVVLWEVVTGARLFKGPNDVATLAETCNKRVPPLRDYVSDAPEMLQHIVSKALSRNPEERYQNAGEMKAALKRFLLETCPESDRDRTASFMAGLFDDVVRQNQKFLYRCLTEEVLESPALAEPGTSLRGAPESPGRSSVPSSPGEQPRTGATPVSSSGFFNHRALDSGDTVTAPTPALGPRGAPCLTPAASTPSGASIGSRSVHVSWTALVFFALGLGALTYGWLLTHRASSQANSTSASPMDPAPPGYRTVQVRFTSEPTGAEVSLGGITLGRTPLERDLERLPAASHAAFVFRLTGFADVTVQSPLAEPQVAVHAELPAVPAPLVPDGAVAPTAPAKMSAASPEDEAPPQKTSTRNNPARAAAKKSRSTPAQETPEAPSPTPAKVPSLRDVDSQRHSAIPIID